MSRPKLLRFGVNPENSPTLLSPLPDGYWTPWHTADLLLASYHDEVTARTCGTCRFAHEWPDGALGCMNARGLNRDEVSPDDGCIKEWATK